MKLGFPIRVGRRLLITGVILATGILLGTLTAETTIPLFRQSSKAVAVYPRNENGDTYGSAFHARTNEEKPDLIEAIGEDGVTGYIRKKDLDGDMPKTPEEATALKNKQQVKDPRQIPLYEKDGKTVIGTFLAGETKPSDTKEE